MEISKLKDRGIIIKTKTASVAINPLLLANSLPADAAECNFVLMTSPEQNLGKFGENKHIFSWPGEYEVQGIAVHACPTGEYSNENRSDLVFVIYTGEGKICYLPPVIKQLSEEIMAAIGDVNLLICEACGDEKLFYSIIDGIEPNALLPLTTENGFSIDSIFVKMGIQKPQSCQKLVFKGKSDFQSDKLSVFLLE